MAANKSVIVLAPNGRRQTVKATINTTILQILEEVCQKQGFNADDYDLKHNRQILDSNATFRFTGLPNNAQLEMVPRAKARPVSNVTISVQPENGERVMREFPPAATLAQVLAELYPDADLKRAVLIYMHREVYGKETLERTTLKSLGLSSGRAILRLIFRDPEQLRTQAHVSAPLAPKPVVALNGSQSDKEDRTVPTPRCSKEADDGAVSTERVSNTEGQKNSGNEERTDKRNERIRSSTDEDQETSARTGEKNQPVATSRGNRDKDEREACARVQEAVHEIQFLGERNALVFNQAAAQAAPRDELPDSFFDLDLHDARTLLRDAKRRREQLEDAPLLTETQRQLDRDKHTLDQLNRYRHTVIRVQFPDQFVLQGVFGLLETVQHVKDFVKNYLDNPECEFSIYTTPPKHTLNPDARLLDENLVPSAIIYYSGESPLKPSVKEKLTDPRAADVEAARSRTARREQNPAAEDDRGTIVEDREDHNNPGPSGYSNSSSQTKTPKWFKQTFQ